MTKVKAKVTFVRIGPRKLSLIAKVVRGKSAIQALNLLRFMPQKAARITEKVIKSAIANAKNNYKLAEKSLIIREAFVTQGFTMKRMQPRAKGRGFPIKKRTSHLTIWVEPKEGA